MSLTSHSLLATMIGLAIYGPAMAEDATSLHKDINNKHAVAEDQSTNKAIANDPLAMVRGVCIAPKDRKEDTNNLPINIEANSAKAKNKHQAVYTGDVIIKQGTRTIAADKVTLQQPENIVTAKGNVFYHDGGIEMEAKQLQSDLNTKDSQLDDAVYRMTCQAGRGEAEQIDKRNVDGTQFYKMKDGTYTTCPEGNKSWRFAAGSLERDGESPFADLYNARFEVLNVPVFYLPWLRIPVTKERMTGFLYPTLTYGSRNGMEYEAPFYWNIAPNYDLTLTPKYMNHRGLQTTAKFRYLTDFGEGHLIGEYMGRDKKTDYDKRWGFQWKHSGIINQNWLVDIDYSKVSDYEYFNSGLDSSIGEREDNNLLQTAEVSYRSTNWDTMLMVRDFQPLTKSGQGTQYRLMPQLSSTYYRNNLGYGLDFKMPMSISKFDNDAKNKPTADRITLEPTLTLPYATPWWSVTTQAKVNYAHYNQDKKKSGLTALKDNVDRVVPELRVNSSLYFERDTSILGSHYTQSLEPQIQYLYIKDVDQKGIYNPFDYVGGGYDSTRLQQDYYGLFSDRTYSGNDYIAPANQFTIGASTRYFDEDFKERFSLSVGQIFYIDKPVNQGTDNKEAKSYSATAVETEFNLDDNLFLKSSMQYDSSENEIQQGSTAVEYRNSGVFIQPSYRYVSSDYLTKYVRNPNPTIDGKQDGISQLGLSVGFPVSNNIDVKADYFQDMNVNKMLESKVGFTYRSACWMIGLSYNRYAKDPLSKDFTEYDSNVSFSFSLLGLQGMKPFGKSSDDGGNILSYGDPFTLNN
ncbi:LPS assembly protein LptD [Photobacterium leiognathi]|uniref:LPS assembly protein LptD n=1 Tax=Photobacterium leiognathi TaxID=553611 RepID=UPI0002088DC3|nr:LPS assembly protein LptD [Photobacterium leiognathi]PSW51932.1 LPS assembly protein LptD [Photobacterium leiognathi subsp. mandapamensis]GAA06944.1 organic solvent tolerance family protein [Photobacterium leiognathi subsp. mandapamensis svers.1.1.]